MDEKEIATYLGQKGYSIKKENFRQCLSFPCTSGHAGAGSGAAVRRIRQERRRGNLKPETPSIGGIEQP